MSLPTGINRIIQEYCYFQPKYIRELREKTTRILSRIDPSRERDFAYTNHVVLNTGDGWDMTCIWNSCGKSKYEKIKSLLLRQKSRYENLGIKTVTDEIYIGNFTFPGINNAYINY